MCKHDSVPHKMKLIDKSLKRSNTIARKGDSDSKDKSMDSEDSLTLSDEAILVHPQKNVPWKFVS